MTLVMLCWEAVPSRLAAICSPCFTQIRSPGSKAPAVSCLCSFLILSLYGALIFWVRPFRCLHALASAAFSRLSFFPPLRHLPKHPVEYLIRQVNGLVDCLTGRNHSDVNLLLTRQTDTSDQTRSEVDHSAIDPWHPCIGIEHRYLDRPCALRTGFLSS